MSMNEPIFKEVYNQLYKVNKDISLREEIAEWAQKFLENDDLIFKDEKSWDLIMILSGIDIETSPSEYLYGKEDFEKWLEEFNPQKN